MCATIRYSSLSNITEQCLPTPGRQERRPHGQRLDEHDLDRIQQVRWRPASFTGRNGIRSEQDEPRVTAWAGGGRQGELRLRQYGTVASVQAAGGVLIVFHADSDPRAVTIRWKCHLAIQKLASHVVRKKVEQRGVPMSQQVRDGSRVEAAVRRRVEQEDEMGWHGL